MPFLYVDAWPYITDQNEELYNCDIMEIYDIMSTQEAIQNQQTVSSRHVELVVVVSSAPDPFGASAESHI